MEIIGGVEGMWELVEMSLLGLWAMSDASEIGSEAG